MKPSFYYPYTERFARQQAESAQSWDEIVASGEEVEELSAEEAELLEAEQFIRETGVSTNVANILYLFDDIGPFAPQR